MDRLHGGLAGSQVFDFAELRFFGSTNCRYDFVDVVTGIAPRPRPTVAEASEFLFSVEDPGDEKRTLLPCDDLPLPRLGFFLMLRLSFF